MDKKIITEVLSSAKFFKEHYRTIKNAITLEKATVKKITELSAFYFA